LVGGHGIVRADRTLAQVFGSGQNEKVIKKWFSQIGSRPGILLGANYMSGGLAD
jgi:hypothetical protein